MTNVFFRATEDALVAITSIFDFVHPLCASLQYSHKVANEHYKKTSVTNNFSYQTIFDPEKKIHGTNYYKAFVQTSYEEQEELLAWVLLNNLFAIHEGWGKRLYDDLFINFNYKEEKFIKKLEREGLSSNMRTYFLKSDHISSFMKDAFYDSYKQKSKLDISKLDNYMLLYRVFKEFRNCYMHNNRLASHRLISAYNDYQPIATPRGLDITEVPVLFAPSLHEPVKLSIRGVIGFSCFLQRILIISDLYLLQTKAAEEELINRKPISWSTKTIGGNTAKQQSHVKRYVSSCGLLKPNYSNELKDYLIHKHILSL